jgi:hypothetical protein
MRVQLELAIAKTMELHAAEEQHGGET